MEHHKDNESRAGPSTAAEIESMAYTDDLFSHPKTIGEFQKLVDQMHYFKRIGDADGLFMTAFQLIPNSFKFKEVSS